MHRYARQILLPNFGIEGQKKLQTSKILIVGAGGLGVPVLQYLTAAGVGEIGIADGDMVSLSNLHRQVIYEESDLGKVKALVAKERLNQQNSDVTINAYDQYLDHSNIFDIIPLYDIVVDCTDNFSTRYLVNDVCFLYKIPLVFASIFQFEFQITVFHHSKNPTNLRDIFPEIPAENSVPNCNESGVLGTIPGIAGIMQANEVIKIITDLEDVLAGKILIFNTKSYTSTVLTIHHNETIFRPQSNEEIIKRNYGYVCKNYTDVESFEELQFLLRDKSSVLIDVREKAEQPKIHQIPVIEIPLSDISQHLAMLHDKNIVIFICQTGVRSIKAINMLIKEYPEKSYFHVVNGMQIFET